MRGYFLFTTALIVMLHQILYFSAESGDTTSDSVVRQRGEELLGEMYERRNRRRNVYASL